MTSLPRKILIVDRGGGTGYNIMIEHFDVKQCRTFQVPEHLGQACAVAALSAILSTLVQSGFVPMNGSLR